MSDHETIEVVVHGMTRSSDRTLVLELRPVAPNAVLPAFEAGAHIDVHLGSLIRQYSLLGSDDETRGYRIGVLREQDGRGGSAAVHDSLRVGDQLRISAPRNTFPLEPSATHSVLIAGGIGLTPLVAMAEHLHRERASFELHAYSASEETLPLREHLADRPWAPRVRLHYSADGDSLRTRVPDAIASPQPGTMLYVCGPPGFIDAPVGYADVAGSPEEAVRVERFVLAEPVETTGASFTVIAASTGQEMGVGEEETIAEVLERNGFQVFLSCEQGICGSCITDVLDGIPDHRDEVQSPAEHASNTLINVCCSRSRTPTLTLDI